MTAIVLFALLFLLIAIGVPIGTSLGVAGMVTIFTFGLGADLIGPNFVAAIASFPLLAIPFFVLAGVIMERAGIAARIAELFEVLVGRATGGLAIVAVLTCMFWGAISGSGPATTAAVGLILIAPMARHGYDKRFAAATIADGAGLSIIIPPSIAFIIYGNVTGTSVSRLFLAGILPGLLMGLGIIVVAWIISHRNGYRGKHPRGGSHVILRALGRAFWALLAPVIILGGIYSSLFTPTEAAEVAVFYSLFVAMVIYRSIAPRELIDVLVDATATTAVIMFIVVFAGMFASAVTTSGIGDRTAQAIIALAPNGIIMILLVNVLLLVLGMFLDAISITYLMMPILIPVLARFEIDPLCYGVIFVTAMAIGQVTPPVGVNLFTAANLVDSDVDDISRAILPFLAVNIVVLVAISLLPALSTWLPALLLPAR